MGSYLRIWNPSTAFDGIMCTTGRCGPFQEVAVVLSSKESLPATHVMNATGMIQPAIQDLNKVVAPQSDSQSCCIWLNKMDESIKNPHGKWKVFNPQPSSTRPKKASYSCEAVEHGSHEVLYSPRTWLNLDGWFEDLEFPCFAHIICSKR